MIYGKNVVLGVSGGIAAYKSCEVVSSLRKLGAAVDVVLTKNAEEFVTPLTFETLSGNAVVRGMFDERKEFDVRHVSLAKKADVLLVAPATADVIAKFARGIADDMLSTVWLATKSVRMIAPAMNTAMYEDAATQENLATLRSRGVLIVEPNVGKLACGDVGKGRMAEPAEIVSAVLDVLQPKRDYAGRRLLVTAGATEENIDGVRVITNHSSGKMGFAIAEAAAERGAEVIIVAGRTDVPAPGNAAEVIRVKSTQDMFDAATRIFPSCDAAVMAAAPADYRLKQQYAEKIKSPTLTLEFVKNPDIAAALGAAKGERKLVIFSAETENLLKNARGKLASKNADLAVANDVTAEGAGFYTDTNIASIITADGSVTEYPLMSKRALADIILDRLSECYGA